MVSSSRSSITIHRKEIRQLETVSWLLDRFRAIDRPRRDYSRPGVHASSEATSRTSGRIRDRSFEAMYPCQCKLPKSDTRLTTFSVSSSLSVCSRSSTKRSPHLSLKRSFVSFRYCDDEIGIKTYPGSAHAYEGPFLYHTICNTHVLNTSGRIAPASGTCKESRAIPGIEVERCGWRSSKGGLRMQQGRRRLQVAGYTWYT